MAVCLIMQFAGVDAGKYEEVMEELGLRGANPDWPSGIISHVAGFVPIGDILGSVPTIRFDCLASRLQCPLWVDTVDKVGDEQRAGNNRIQVPRFLNQCCAPDSYLESMLLTRPSKNVFRQHRSLADAATSSLRT
jgi:8-oxo-dGTP pyrophosphatase MutT (NUDIX family)